jgi:hypothetical protein
MTLLIGWAQTDLTPEKPVALHGQFHVRISEGVEDPITATALALASEDARVVFVSCDLCVISDDLHAAVLERLDGVVPPDDLVMHATHTHNGPETSRPDGTNIPFAVVPDVDLPVMPTVEYLAFAADRIADAVHRAWASCAPGSVAYGLGFAVVGRNRRWVARDGVARMYGDTNTPRFGHIEGTEDHSVGVLATYDAAGALTGVVVNVPCPSQVIETRFVVSADYWHTVRQELRQRLGDDLFVLAQCSAAGDQSPHPIYEKPAHERMWRLAGMTERAVLAGRICDAVESTLSLIGDTAASDARLEHRAVHLDLAPARITDEQVAEADAQAAEWADRLEEERAKLRSDPSLREQPRWYVPLTRAARRRAWFASVSERRRQQAERPAQPVDLHLVRLGDAVFATNPFEFYLDFGIAVQCRSRAIQTFLVQLAGPGSYMPSERSTAGGGYGSVPASNRFGPDAGWRIVERTVAEIDGLFSEVASS